MICSKLSLTLSRELVNISKNNIIPFYLQQATAIKVIWTIPTQFQCIFFQFDPIGNECYIRIGQRSHISPHLSGRVFIKTFQIKHDGRNAFIPSQFRRIRQPILRG